MELLENRPYVICHIVSSVDGKIDGEFFGHKSMSSTLFYNQKIRKQYNCDAVLNGTITCAEIYADGYITPPKTKNEYLRKDHIVKTNHKHFVLCIDTQGTLKWHSNEVNRTQMPVSHVIEILCENVSDDYLEYLHDLQISYIFAGKEELDISLLLHKCKKLLHIDTIMMTGGGIIDWSFLHDGYIDELSLLLAPLTDGLVETTPIFNSSPFHNHKTISFTLLDTKVYENNIRLIYKPNNRKD